MVNHRAGNSINTFIITKSPLLILWGSAYIEEDFRRWPTFDKTPRVASHSDQGVIEPMPRSDGIDYGFKYVNGHSKNMKDGLQTVTAFGLRASVDPVIRSC